MELGQQFHRLVQQYFSGIDRLILFDSINSAELAEWWQVFLTLDLVNKPGVKTAEKAISIPFNRYRLTAQYDLLIEEPGRKFTIYDWKTSAHKPKMHDLLNRVQSIAYPFILQTALNRLQDEAKVEIEMIYWFPAHPTQPISFRYSADQYSRDGERLTGLVNEIVEHEDEWFVRTSDDARCRFCRYRSHCARGVNAGVAEDLSDELTEEISFDFDFDML